MFSFILLSLANLISNIFILAYIKFTQNILTESDPMEHSYANVRYHHRRFDFGSSDIFNLTSSRLHFS